MQRKADGFPDQVHLVIPPPVVAAALRAPITRDLLPTAVGYFPSAAGHFIHRSKGCSDHILILCAAGEGWVEGPGGRHSMRANEIVLLPANTSHRYGARGSAWTIYWCHFTGRLAPDFAGLASRHAGLPEALGSPARAFGGIETLIEIQRAGYGRIELVRAATTLAAWFGLLHELRAEVCARGGSAGERVLAVAQMLRTRMTEQFSIEEMAASAGLSPSHFSALFRARLGYSPLDFHLRARVQRACELLVSARSSIAAVAGAVGFSDALYFSRVFRRVMKESPSGYIERQGRRTTPSSSSARCASVGE